MKLPTQFSLKSLCLIVLASAVLFGVLEEPLWRALLLAVGIWVVVSVAATVAAVGSDRLLESLGVDWARHGRVVKLVGFVLGLFLFPLFAVVYVVLSIFL